MFQSWFFQTRAVFEEICGICKHCQIVIFHIFLRNMYNLFQQCKTFFVYLPISPSPCHPFICFINYPFPLCSPCSDFEQIQKGVQSSIIFKYFIGFLSFYKFYLVCLKLICIQSLIPKCLLLHLVSIFFFPLQNKGFMFANMF